MFLSLDWSVFSVILFGTTLLLSVSIFKKFRSKVDPTVNRLRPSCLPSLPLVGSLLFLPWYDIKSVPSHLMKLAEKYGSIFALYAGPAYVVCLNGRKAIEDCFLKQSTIFADRHENSVEKQHANPKMKGLIFAKFDKTYKFNHTLSLSILKELGFGNNNLTQDRILVELEKLVEEIRQKKGRAFDPLPLYDACVSSVFLGMMFDRTVDYSDSRHLAMARYSKDLLDNLLPALELFPIVKCLSYFKKRINKYVEASRSMLDILKQETEEAVKRSSGNSFVEKYIQNVGKEDDPEQLSFILRDLVFAGNDTVATTLRWALVMLADHPHIQAWLQEEIDSVIPPGRLPKLDDEPNLPRVRAAILELMRWKPIGPLPVQRRTLRDTEVNGLFIPAGTMVVANIYSVSKDPEVWTDPVMYKPERFLDKDGQVYGGDRIIPFSLGRRSCLGEILARQEIFIFFCGIVQQFTVLPPDGRTSMDVTEQYDGVILAPSTFEIVMHARK